MTLRALYKRFEVCLKQVGQHSKDSIAFIFSSQSTLASLILYVSANQGYVETLYFFMFQLFFFCCGKPAVKVLLGFDT